MPGGVETEFAEWTSIFGLWLFNPWAGVSCHSSEEIYCSLFECYTAYYSGQVEEWKTRMSSGAAVRSGFTVGRVPADCSRSESCSSSQAGKRSKRAARQGKSCLTLLEEKNFR